MLLRLIQPEPASDAGQNVPAAADAGSSPPPASTPAPPAPPPPPPDGGDASRFAQGTLATLLNYQETPPSSSDIAAKVIGQMDSDGDGSLSLDEVKSALGQSSNLDPSKLSDAFNKLDTNGDGKLSADELSSAMDAMKARHGHHHHHHQEASSSDEAQGILAKVDTDNSGSITLAEIGTATGADVSGAQNAFASLDTNGDGALSADELKAAIDAFRQSLEGSLAKSTTAETASGA
jgi:Ca2+-binding EF-hand superfamily protein